MNTRLHAAVAAPDACAVFYGTSLTRAGGWVEMLAAELQPHCPALRIVNAAEGGQHSRWGRAHFAARVLMHRPTVVFLEFAINDAVARFGITVGEAQANLEAMLDALQAARPRSVAVLQVMNPVIDRPAGHDGHRPHLADHEAMWRRVARARAALLVDHAPAWAAVLARGEGAFRQCVPDGLHPTPEAHRQHLLPALRAALGLPAAESDL